MGHNSTPQRFAVEALEERRLLAGVTLITHGYQPTSSSQPAWLDQMKDSLVTQLGSQTAVYELRIARINNGTQPAVTQFDWISGTAPWASNNGEVVVMLDWADASGVVFSYFNTADLAGLVAPYFLGVDASKGLTHPLAELPVHLIGHSRGASLVSELAADLGERGIWVNHVTTLDPHPVSPDPAVSFGSTVVFADNYYETTGTFGIAGASVNGAYNVNLTPYGWTSHESVHTYYDMAIDQASSPGYASSRAIGGVRPSSGFGSNFGGSAAHTRATSRTGSQWPNVDNIQNKSGSSLPSGSKVNLSVLFQDYDSNTTITWFADNDKNPYNGNERSLLSQATTTRGDNVYIENAQVPTASLTPGVWQMLVRISDGVHSRYAYLKQPISLTATTPPPSASVSGVIYLDANGNGKKEEKEKVLVNVRVFLDKDNNRIMDPGEQFAYTDRNGKFSITGVKPGKYTLCVFANGRRIIGPKTGVYTLSLASGTNSTGRNFALR